MALHLAAMTPCARSRNSPQEGPSSRRSQSPLQHGTVHIRISFSVNPESRTVHVGPDLRRGVSHAHITWVYHTGSDLRRGVSLSHSDQQSRVIAQKGACCRGLQIQKGSGAYIQHAREIAAGAEVNAAAMQLHQDHMRSCDCQCQHFHLAHKRQSSLRLCDTTSHSKDSIVRPLPPGKLRDHVIAGQRVHRCSRGARTKTPSTPYKAAIEYIQEHLPRS